MNKNELIKMLTERRAPKIELTEVQFLDALATAQNGDRMQLLHSLNKKETKSIAELMIKITWQYRLDLAKAEVEAAFADDTVTTAELLSYL